VQKGSLSPTSIRAMKTPRKSESSYSLPLESFPLKFLKNQIRLRQ
jgi:hypothetical protein